MKEKTIYALGFFDGVHLGHLALLERCRSMADDLGCNAGVVTFLGHPDALVHGQAPTLINTPQDRKKLLRQFHIDTAQELPFDKALMEMPWQDFFAMLVTWYGAAGLVCGSDFRFGRRGEGTAEKLRNACQAAGIPCAVVPEQTLDGVRISSTHIRNLLEQGDIRQANRFLGHPHILSGTVIRGKQLGRTIGIPTANLAYPEGLAKLPFGVYACTATVDGQRYRAVTNIGTRPTVSGTSVTVEPWLLDFSGDLYGQTLILEFYDFLRPEKKFDSLQELAAQIRQDAVITQKVIS